MIKKLNNEILNSKSNKKILKDKKLSDSLKKMKLEEDEENEKKQEEQEKNSEKMMIEAKIEEKSKEKINNQKKILNFFQVKKMKKDDIQKEEKKELFTTLEKCKKREIALNYEINDESFKIKINSGGEYLYNNFINEMRNKKIIFPKKNNKKRKVYLLFNDSYRPWKGGIFEKTSTIINARKPIAKDLTLIDYEIDSEDEYEEKV